LLQSGVVLAGGSDWFVAPASPIEGIRAFVTRETLDGKNPEGFVVNEKISVEQALRAYTIDAAFAGFDEHLKGSLEEGKLADFVMLDQDLLSVPAKSIKDTRVLMTVLGGRVVYAADDVQLAQRQQDDREL
jgi:predicted amidohydrolase YtcJ